MPFFESLLSGFDTRRREVRAEETAKADQAAAREFSILQALAQHPDPDLASLGTAGILELAGGTRPAKGLRGFMGEMERSSFYPQLQQMLRQPEQEPQTPPVQPGAGALPASSPVEPRRQASGPPTLAAGPAGGAASAPPEMRMLPGAGALDTTPPSAPPGMPEMLQATAGPGALPQMPAGPPPPETPVARYRRLYPTAAQIAGEQTYQQRAAYIRAAIEGLRTARTPQEAALVSGISGAPPRAEQSKGFNARYLDANGMEQRGWVVFDPYNETTTVDGQPVRVLEQLPATQARPVGVDVVGPEGTMNRQFVDPATGRVVSTVARGVPPPPEPSDFTGGITWVSDAAGNPVAVRPTRTGMAVVPGVQPPPSRTPAVNPAAVGMLRAVERQLAAMAKPAFPGMPVPPVTAQAMDQVTQKLSNGRWQTYAELAAAAATRTSPGTAEAAGGPASMEDMAESVLRRLGAGRSTGSGGGRSSTVVSPPSR